VFFQSRHVSALTSDHIQVILVILNIKIEVTIHYNGSVESNGIYVGKIAVVYVKVAKYILSLVANEGFIL
jgi:hypothetical protein